MVRGAAFGEMPLGLPVAIPTQFVDCERDYL